MVLNSDEMEEPERRGEAGMRNQRPSVVLHQQHIFPAVYRMLQIYVGGKSTHAQNAISIYCTLHWPVRCIYMAAAVRLLHVFSLRRNCIRLTTQCKNMAQNLYNGVAGQSDN